MDKPFQRARAFRFRTKDKDLFRMATASGSQYLAGRLEKHDWPLVPSGSLVFVHIGSTAGPLLAGKVAANTLEVGESLYPATTSGLLLKLNLAEEAQEIPQLFAQRDIRTVYLALEHLASVLP